MALLKLFIEFAGNPTGAAALKAPYKFNKVANIALTWDDGNNIGADKGYEIFTGVWQTDGCGNNINYTAGISLNCGTGNPGDFGYNENYIQEPYITNKVNNGWSFENHGDTHGSDGLADPIVDTNNLHNRILLRTGYKIGFTDVPTNYNGYVNAAYLLEYDGATSQGDSVGDQFKDVRVHKVWPPLADPYEFLFIIREFTDEWSDTPTLNFFKSMVDEIGTPTRDFLLIGTHSGFETSDKLNGFSDFINYIFETRNDDITFSSIREVLDYRRMYTQSMEQSLVGNILTVTINVDDPTNTLRWSDISLIVTADEDIVNVTFEGFESISFNPVTGLVNGFKQRKSWANVEPPVAGEVLVTHGNFIVPEPPEEPDLFVPTAEEELFTFIYYSGKSKKYGTNIPAVNGDSIGSIDAVKGGSPIIYRGIANPAVTGVPPYLLDGRYLVFDNCPNTHYESDVFATIDPPYEQWVVMRTMPGQDYEGWTAGGDNGAYSGDLSYAARIINSGYGIVPGSNSLAPDYELAIQRIRINTNNTAEYWLNGISKGIVIFQGGDIDGVKKKLNAIGVNTNVADFDCAAVYNVSRAFTDSEATAITNSLISKWGVGSIPDEILLHNINITNISGIWTPSWNVENRTEYDLADPNNWDYIWHYKNDQTNFAIQEIIGTERFLPTSAYPPNGGGITGGTIKVRIRPKDVDGRTWQGRYISGLFKDINA